MSMSPIDLSRLDAFFNDPPWTRRLPVPQPAPELRTLAIRLMPFAGRVLPWAGRIEGKPFYIEPPVFEVEPLFFAMQAQPHTAGWFVPREDRIIIASPVNDTFKQSVVLHESVHWLQYHALADMGWHVAEFEAYKVQMAWLATQGFDVRGEGKFFSASNLLAFTHRVDLYVDNYAWLEPWEKEYRP